MARLAHRLLPLLLAFAAGVLLMAGVSALRGAPDHGDRRIAITPDLHRALAAGGALDAWLDEEVMVREALARGLALDDLVIRRQLQRRLRALLLAESPQAPPDDATLQAWLDTHAERYQAQPRWSFEQVYLSRAAHGAALNADAQAIGAKLQAQPDAAAGLGDPFPQGRRFEAVSSAQVEAAFGGVLLKRLGECPTQQWCGPVTTSLGAHWLRLGAQEPARRLTLEEARSHLRADVEQDRQQQQLRRALDALRAGYSIVDDATHGIGIRPVAADEEETP